jgi:hypothetical protein
MMLLQATDCIGKLFNLPSQGRSENIVRVSEGTLA